MKVSGHLVDIHNRDIYRAVITCSGGRIIKIERTNKAADNYILPGLIDAHIHIESSMLTPGAFAQAAVRHGTTGVVSDPHEIANVLGSEGIEFMLKDAGKVPVQFWFGAPSCVPATARETSGAVLDVAEVYRLLQMPQIKYLSEMMNFPGVISGDKSVLGKIDIAKKLGKPIDGHAPGLSGEALRQYVSAGISTDHECSSMEEAKEKISLGMKILIREGSAARNLEALKGLYLTDPDMIMLCSDDLHPEMLMKRHINRLIGGLISDGYNLFDVIRSATINPVKHYNLEAGLLRVGDKADLIVVDSLRKMKVIETWIDGKRVYGNNKVLFSYKAGKTLNRFNCTPLKEKDLKVNNLKGEIRIIEAFDGKLITKEITAPSGTNSFVEPDLSNDVLKIVVKDRYSNSQLVVGFIKGFGLRKGAFASSVAHDSHNIISVGTNDKDITDAINEIIRLKGGLSVSSGGTVQSLQLNIAGIMTNNSCEDVARDYENLNSKVRSLGSKMTAPFMTLSFMALLVIPELKIGDQGLFDVNKFQLVPLFVN